MIRRHVASWHLPCGAANLLVASLILVPQSLAGECVNGERDGVHWVEDLEAMSRGGPPPGHYEAFDCLTCKAGSWSNWAGPVAAARFAACRKHVFRDRIAAACLPLLADSSGTALDGHPKLAAAVLVASFGFGRVGEQDVYSLLASHLRSSPRSEPPTFMALAAARDPRTTALLMDLYSSIETVAQAERSLFVRDILNCLYHIPGDSAIALAREIRAHEPSLELKERASRVIDR